jgi:pyruvate carboxylase
MRGSFFCEAQSFLLAVLEHPEFVDGTVDTSFIQDNPHLLEPMASSNRGQKLLKYIGQLIVNGPPAALGAVGEAPSSVDPALPVLSGAGTFLLLQQFTSLLHIRLFSW